MSTISDKLELLQSTKADIQSAIAEKGQVISEATPFSAYADLIRSIPSGIDESKLKLKSYGPTNIGYTTSTSITFTDVLDYNFFTILPYNTYQAWNKCPNGYSFVSGIVGSKKDKNYIWMRTAPDGSTVSSGSINSLKITESNGTVTFSIPSTTPSYNTYFIDGYILYCVTLVD